MKVQEFIEIVKSNKNKMLKGEQFQQLVCKTLEVKDYMSIKQKKELVDEIINECVMYEDGIFKFDDIDKYICFTMKTIAAYTNIELSMDIEDDYDSLCKAKLLNVVVDTFACEYENVKLLLQMKCDYILSSNNIEAQVGKFLNEILDKVDNITNAVSNKIEDFDVKKLPIDANILNKLMEFVNSQKK